MQPRRQVVLKLIKLRHKGASRGWDGLHPTSTFKWVFSLRASTPLKTSTKVVIYVVPGRCPGIRIILLIGPLQRQHPDN